MNYKDRIIKNKEIIKRMLKIKEIIVLSCNYFLKNYSWLASGFFRTPSKKFITGYVLVY